MLHPDTSVRMAVMRFIGAAGEIWKTPALSQRAVSILVLTLADKHAGCLHASLNSMKQCARARRSCPRGCGRRRTGRAQGLPLARKRVFARRPAISILALPSASAAGCSSSRSGSSLRRFFVKLAR